MVLYHHNHTKSNYPDLCSILKKADHHSASEREDIDDTQEVNKTPLISLFSKIVLEGNGKVDEQYIPLNKLSLDDGSFNNLKPAAKKDTMGGWNLVPEYNRLWDEFNSEFELIQNKTDFNTLLALLKNAPDNENMELKEITAIVYMDLNYYNEALELFNEILDADYNRSVLDLKVDCLFFLGKFEDVVKTADEYLEVFGNNLDVLTNKKAALKKLNRKNEAEEVNNIISNLNAVNKFAVYMPKDQTDEVIPDEIYERELELCFNDLKYNPDDSTVLIAIATFLYNLDRRDESIEYLDKISDDADSVTINAKACMFMKLEKFPKALETLNKSLKKDKTNIITLISKSECLMELKKYEEVLVCADEGLEIDKTNIPLWKNKFCALIELDRLIEAKEVQDLIFDLEIANDKAEGSLKKAINRFYSMEYRECLNLCYDVLDADKDNEEAAILMMNVVYLLGDLNEAPKALYRALNCNGGEILTRN